LRTLGRRVCIWAVLPLTAFGVVFWFLLGPWLAARWLEEEASMRIRGRLRVGGVTLGLRVIDVENAELQDATGRVLARADHAAFRLDRAIWAGGRPEIHELRLEGLEVEATLEQGGTWDVQRALQRPDAPAPPSGGGTPGPPPPPTPPTLEVVEITNAFLLLHTPLGTARISSISSRIDVELSRLRMNADGTAYAGRVTADGWFSTSGTEEWSVQVNASGLDVRALARGSGLSDRNLEGALHGFLSIDRIGADPPAGAGWLDIRDGRLFDLPIFLAIFNVLRFESPTDATIHTCRSDFRILPGFIRIDRGYLLSRGPGLFGTGRIRLPSGELELEFIPRLSGEPPEGWEVLAEGEQPLGDFLRRHALVTVELRGTWREPAATVIPVKVISGPIRDFFRLLEGGR